MFEIHVEILIRFRDENEAVLSSPRRWLLSDWNRCWSVSSMVWGVGININEFDITKVSSRSNNIKYQKVLHLDIRTSEKVQKNKNRFNVCKPFDGK